MKKIPLTILLTLILFPFPVLAAICGGPLVPCGYDLNDDGVVHADEMCNFCHLFELFNNVLEFILTCLVPIVAVLMITIGGIMFMLSHLEMLPITTFSQAKGIVTAAVIGLLIIFGSWVFLNTFLTTIGVAEWTGMEQGWWDITCSSY